MDNTLVNLPTFKKANPALHPFMGWSSWSAIRQNVDAHIVKAQARVIVARLKKFGYDYVNVDGGWQQGYDHYGRPKPNLTKFPGGMAPLASWLHQRGLKLGIYLLPGIDPSLYQANDPIVGTHYTTRQIVYKNSKHGNTKYTKSYMLNFSNPGAMAYLQSCADLFASWGVDYIKLDYVGPSGGDSWPYRGVDCRSEVAHFALALSRCGRPIWLELSANLKFADAAFWAKYANGWRTNGDIESYKHDLTDWKNVMVRFNKNARWAPYAGPGHWNDFDSLDIGNGKRDGLTSVESQTVMIFWCINCSPLCLGADLTRLTPGGFNIITNKAAIAIDQAGHPATPLSQKTPQQVWVIHNADGSCTVAMFNLAKTTAKVGVTWRQLNFAKRTANVKDLWAQKQLGAFSTSFTATLPAHGSRLLKISPAH
ncbi:MAG: glycoside hydrolase family 27 protein [Phycisphaerales bacterium]|nr:glycoside hydrolase family 27 protein [Phycisphaerales bacterium]